uniref:Uncharacterized protein n=1 Tax=Rhizophora mucronata TaxID=61149 RepID=A0A2P2PQN3_RHIMU
MTRDADLRWSAMLDEKVKQSTARDPSSLSDLVGV